MPNITIIGMGALGILYGDILTASLGRDAVIFLADERRIQRYRQEGVCCNGKTCDFQMSSQAKPADLLIFAVKGNALNDAMRAAEQAVGEDTIILSVLNGISSEEILADHFQKGHIIHCIAQGMDAVKLGNKLTYSHKGELRIGTPDPSLATFVAQTAQILKSADVPCTIEEVITFYVNLLDSLDPDGMPSMRQDGISRRYSEVDLFAGTVLQKAAEYGLSVPINRMLYDKIKEMEADY